MGGGLPFSVLRKENTQKTSLHTEKYTRLSQESFTYSECSADFNFNNINQRCTSLEDDTQPIINSCSDLSSVNDFLTNSNNTIDEIKHAAPQRRNSHVFLCASTCSILLSYFLMLSLIRPDFGKPSI